MDEAQREIAGHRRLEEALEQRCEELARANRHKDEFLALLGHELLNPLGAIRNALRLAQQPGAAPAVVASNHEVAVRQVNQIARLTEDLLDVSRIAGGKMRLQPERLDLVPLVRNSVADYRSLLDEAGLTTVLELAEGPLWVQGDPTRLTQVLGTLLWNAATFTPGGRHVTVRLEAEQGGEWAALTVRDTGIGIEAEMLPKLFQPYTQADGGRERRGQGPGLGLALVKGVVELHGGEVRAHSDGPGRGALFAVRLPLVRSPLGSEEPPAPAMASGSPARILVIDDSGLTLVALSRQLHRWGHEVVTAHSGPAGVDLARRFQPDVVLCEMELPEMDGCEVARALRRDPATTRARLIAITGYGRQEEPRLREAGFELHLTKPIPSATLQRILAACSRNEPVA